MRSPPNDRARPNRNGFSLIETLVMLAMFAIVAGLVLECAVGGVSADQRLAARAEDGTVRLAGAAVFHALLRDATLVHGDHRTLQIAQQDAETLGCTAIDGVVLLAIEANKEGGRLTCAPDADRRPLLRWQGGDGRFSYSDGMQAWGDRPPVDERAADQRTPVLVRLELINGPRDRLAWIERVGVLR